jgi:hypothetical protein
MLPIFEWDKLVFFGENSATKDEVETAIKQKFDGFEEYTRPMIFLYKHKIVYTENNPLDVEQPTQGEIRIVELSNSLSSSHIIINKDNDKFHVRFRKWGSVSYYELYR